MVPLLEKLIAKQKALGLTDKEFAAVLGVPRSTWQLTRSGVIRLGPRVALAARRAFPELTDEVIAFLLSDASPLVKSASK